MQPEGGEPVPRVSATMRDASDRTDARPPVVCFAMAERAFAAAFDDAALHRLDQVATIVRDERGRPRLVNSFEDGDWAQVHSADILVTGWGAPRIDADVIGHFDHLEAVVHSGGTVKTFLDPDVWDSGVAVSSAADANAIPVAEFTLATVIFARSRASRHIAAYRATGHKRSFDINNLTHGTNGITVGVVGASRIGRRVIELLQVLDATVLISDPFLDDDEASALGGELVELPDLLRRSDVVTLHAPENRSTRHMIGEGTLPLMRDGAVLVNTARGSLVDTAALEPHVVSGRLDAYLDVTEPEPLPKDSALFGLPNVVLTPHIAGSLGNEVLRMGSSAVDEVERLAAGRGLQFPVRASDLGRIA
jgi:phosphoglycerate dehydrogenase-like enzyme